MNYKIVTLSQKIQMTLDDIIGAVLNDMYSNNVLIESRIDSDFLLLDILSDIVNGKNNDYDSIIKKNGFTNVEKYKDTLITYISLSSYIDTIYKQKLNIDLDHNYNDIYNIIENSNSSNEVVAGVKKNASLIPFIFNEYNDAMISNVGLERSKKFETLVSENKINKIIQIMPDLFIEYLDYYKKSMPEDILTSKIMDCYGDELSKVLLKDNASLYNIEENGICSADNQVISSVWEKMKHEYIGTDEGVNKIGYIVGNVYTNLKTNERFLGKSEINLLYLLEQDNFDIKMAYVLFMTNRDFATVIIDNFTVFNPVVSPTYRQSVEDKLDSDSIEKMKKFNKYYKRIN